MSPADKAALAVGFQERYMEYRVDSHLVGENQPISEFRLANDSFDFEWAHLLDVQFLGRTSGLDVLPVKPDHVAHINDGGFSCMPIVVFFIGLLGSLEVGSEDGVESAEPLYELFSCQIDRGIAIVADSEVTSGIISIISEEGRSQCRGALGVVIYEFSVRKEIVPIVLLVVAINSKVLL